MLKKIKDETIKNKIALANCSDISNSSLNEVIKSPELKNVLQTSKARQEQLVVDELLKEINKDNLASYGWNDVKKAVSAGAVNSLLLTDDFIQKKRSTGDFIELDQLMQQVDSMQGKIEILTSNLDSGKKINGLGGIAALLRYKF